MALKPHQNYKLDQSNEAEKIDRVLEKLLKLLLKHALVKNSVKILWQNNYQ